MLQVLWWRQTVLKSIRLILIPVRGQQGVLCDVKSRRRRDVGCVWILGGRRILVTGRAGNVGSVPQVQRERDKGQGRLSKTVRSCQQVQVGNGGEQAPLHVPVPA